MNYMVRIVPTSGDDIMLYFKTFDAANDYYQRYKMTEFDLSIALLHVQAKRFN
jgi:hypothetical protein